MSTAARAGRHVVVMVATSYPRFPGDGIGSFMEPIAKGVAARGHDVHLVAPWHPAITRPAHEDGVTFHFFQVFAGGGAFENVFGYATSLRADTALKFRALAIAPVAVAAGWREAARVARAHRATVMHGHWVIPGGVMAALAARKLPLVISLHGSDVFIAERHGLVGRAARAVFRRASWVTAPSDDLRLRAEAIGADPARAETVPYGVDASRFAPSAETRAAVRRELGLDAGTPLIFTAGRLVSKKGFEYLIDAARLLAMRVPSLRVAIAGDGDLREALAARAAGAAQILWLGQQAQDRVGRLAAAADVIAVPSIRDAAGNVDGLPNFALGGAGVGDAGRRLHRRRPAASHRGRCHRTAGPRARRRCARRRHRRTAGAAGDGPPDGRRRPGCRDPQFRLGASGRAPRGGVQPAASGRTSAWMMPMIWPWSWRSSHAGRLAAIVQCPACLGACGRAADRGGLACERCRTPYRMRDGVLIVDLSGERPEVAAERAGVRTTERNAALGGINDAFDDLARADGALKDAILALPEGDDSRYYREPGYFLNVKHSLRGFRFVTRRLSRTPGQRLHWMSAPI